MKQITCLIADDEVLARDVLTRYVGRLDHLRVVATCATGLEVYQALASHRPDLLLLDIDMPQLTGLELLRSLPQPPAVILTTAYREFALEAYELNVLDYLLKPVSFERFLRAVGKYAQWANPGAGYAPPPAGASPPPGNSFADAFLYVKADKKMVRVALPEILYLEGLKDCLRIQTTSGQVLTYQSLAEFEQRLPATHFLRVHRSYLVSLAHISTFSALELTVASRVIPIGTTYAREVGRVLHAQGLK